MLRKERSHINGKSIVEVQVKDPAARFGSHKVAKLPLTEGSHKRSSVELTTKNFPEGSVLQ